MICANCGEHMNPPNMLEVYDPRVGDWVHVHRQCPRMRPRNMRDEVLVRNLRKRA